MEYTAPVFWLFFLLVGVSLFVLRRRDPDLPRPFRVPLYPVLPLLFWQRRSVVDMADLERLHRITRFVYVAMTSPAAFVAIGTGTARAVS